MGRFVCNRQLKHFGIYCNSFFKRIQNNSEQVHTVLNHIIQITPPAME